MGNRILAQLLDRERYLPIVSGFVVAIVHFVSSFLLDPLSCEFSLEYYVAFVLSIPGFVLGFIIDSLPLIYYRTK
jgi:hypothetical protein